MRGAGSGRRVVVCLGDSITAMGWPEQAAALLEDTTPPGAGMDIVNRGIPGNRLLRDGGPLNRAHGRSGLARFAEDVLGVPGVTDVVVALGTNDLGLPGDIEPLSDLPTSAELLEGLRQLADRAERAGLGVCLATVPPRLGSSLYDQSRESIRVAVNDGVRGSGSAYVDFDAALRSAADPARLDQRYDSGDHLHPNDAGQRRLAQEFLVRVAGALVPPRPAAARKGSGGSGWDESPD
ncbi:GDSL-type esterase/lipase family protein [Nocardioides sp. BP30]|uniref:GDSL-type esterase/lipase family protein n=1 Tax=Nocardioides sp. BP30 TaxID=3036374 RepID=UPI0024698414|nr:GDSL-type esterase/lipase family protein [Nocardioides sp. BP30]WGL52172.1 GDSL-type esterase/lipase family protein [Nocardioides sp. BP30]